MREEVTHLEDGCLHQSWGRKRLVFVEYFLEGTELCGFDVVTLNSDPLKLILESSEQREVLI